MYFDVLELASLSSLSFNPNIKIQDPIFLSMVLLLYRSSSGCAGSNESSSIVMVMRSGPKGTYDDMSKCWPGTDPCACCLMIRAQSRRLSIVPNIPSELISGEDHVTISRYMCGPRCSCSESARLLSSWVYCSILSAKRISPARDPRMIQPVCEV